MFHIFYVNEGYMMVLEPSSLRFVLDLQKCIQDKAKVELQEQVKFFLVILYLLFYFNV